MRCGDLNTLVSIEHKTRLQDDLLNRPEKWEEFASAWFAPAIAAGAESQPNQQTVSTNTSTWETHWSEQLSLVTPKMRFKLTDGRVLGIKSVVNEKMANRKLIITCEGLS